MPLHKSSSRASRLDPTMISAPLGDFRHTMHIGRGGDAFGDTSFLSTLGPSPPSSDTGSAGVAPGADPEVAVNHGDLHADAPGSPEDSELYSESVSLFTLDLDLDLDLGPSMLGDVLGVMDGLGLDSKEEEDDALSPKSATSSVEKRQGKEATGMSVNTQNELNGKYSVGLDGDQVGESRIPDGNGIKPKGLKPKVRFSDKREEIIRQASEEEEGQGFDFQDENQLLRQSPTRGESERRGESRVVAEGETEFVNHKVGVELPPSPASSHSSENEGDAVPLDRRRSDKVDNCHSETDSEEDEDEEEEEEEEEEGGEAGRGYTFEDEFDDEIGL